MFVKHAYAPTVVYTAAQAVWLLPLLSKSYTVQILNQTRIFLLKWNIMELSYEEEFNYAVAICLMFGSINHFKPNI